MIIGTPREVFSFLKNLPSDSKVKVQEIKETRSQRQNRLYWQWIGDLVQCFDEKGIFITCDELHEGLREKLIPGHGRYRKISHANLGNLSPLTNGFLVSKKIPHHQVKDFSKL